MLRNTALALATLTLALAPPVASADQKILVNGAFTVTFTATPNVNSTSYCGSAEQAVVEAHGAGDTALGPMSLALQKTLTVPGSMYGCLTLRALNGDTLTANYAGTIEAPDANYFSPFSGTFTFTGGTGQFKNATGTASFTAWANFFYPSITFLTAAKPALPVQGVAIYLVQGTVSIPDSH